MKTAVLSSSKQLFPAKSSRRQSAQGLVEFALVLPLLLLIVFGLIEFARLLAIYAMISSASRDAARYGAAAGDVGNQTPHYLDCAGIRTAARRNSFLAPISDANITISYDHGPGTAVFSTSCPATVPVQLGDRITVQVVANFEPIVPLVGLKSFPITSITKRTILTSVEVKGTPAPGGGPIVSFTTPSQVKAENAGSVAVQVQLTAPSTQNISVPFSLSGSAQNGADYSISSSPLVIPAGSTLGTITVNITNDAADEDDETVIITLGTPTNATKGSPDVFTLTITDDDDPPAVYFHSSAQAGGESSGMTVQIQLSAASGKDVTIPFYATGTAAEGVDYSMAASPVTIPAGSSSVLLGISVVDDTLDEDDETVILTMGTPTNATKGSPDTHTATILDNDNPPVVSFDLASQSAPEAMGNVMVKAQLSAASSKDVVVPFTLGGTATLGADYTITASPLTIPAGSTLAEITITLVQDEIPESDETVIVTMGTPVNATKGSPSVHTATILGTATQPTVAFAAASQTVNENGGTKTVRIQLSNLWNLPVTAPFTISGTATRGDSDDYTINTSSVTIPVGSLYADVTITVNNDGWDEDDETVILTLGTPTNATVGSPSVHTTTITDDDPTPIVTILVGTSSATEAVGSIQMTVQLSSPSSKTVSVPFGLGAGTQATLGDDFTMTSSPLILAPGVTSAIININVVDDVVYGEPNEPLIVTLGTPTNAVLGDPATQTATFTILENDACPSLGTLSTPNREAKLFVLVSNPSATAVQIDTIELNWVDNDRPNGHPNAQELKYIYLGSSVIIWQGHDYAPVTFVPAEGAWAVPGTSRQIDGYSSQLLGFYFNVNLSISAQDYVSVTFNNGCTATASRSR